MGEFYKPESIPDVSGKSEQDIIGGGFDFAKIERKWKYVYFFELAIQSRNFFLH